MRTALIALAVAAALLGDAGASDGGGVTMDALSLPAAGSVDSTAAVLDDYSKGNDAIIVKNAGISPKKQAEWHARNAMRKKRDDIGLGLAVAASIRYFFL